MLLKICVRLSKAFNLENLLAGHSRSPARPKVKPEAKLRSPGKGKAEATKKKEKDTKSHCSSAAAKKNDEAPNQASAPAKPEAASRFETKSQPSAMKVGEEGWVIF